MRIASIVEGDGEVLALPVLLRRLAGWRTQGRYVDVRTPIRVRRDRFLNREEDVSRHLLLAAAKAGEDGWVLVLLDADDDCPASKGAEVLQRAKSVVPHRSVSVVLANREFEAWFIAAASSLSGHRGFMPDPRLAVHAETPRDAKGWMKSQMASRAYSVTTDQPAFCARFDLDQAHAASRSFRKLCSEWDRYVHVEA